MAGHPNTNLVVFTNLILLGPLIGARKHPWAVGGVLLVIALVNAAFTCTAATRPITRDSSPGSTARSPRATLDDEAD